MQNKLNPPVKLLPVFGQINKTKSYLLLPALLACIVSFSQTVMVSERIKVNQLGYYINAPKIAVVTGTTDAQSFFVTSTNIKDTLFRGTLTAEMESRNS